MSRIFLSEHSSGIVLGHRSGRTALAVLLSIATLVFILDQVTKVMITPGSDLDRDVIALILSEPGLAFRYARNSGAVFWAV